MAITKTIVFSSGGSGLQQYKFTVPARVIGISVENISSNTLISSNPSVDAATIGTGIFDQFIAFVRTTGVKFPLSFPIPAGHSLCVSWQGTGVLCISVEI